MSEAAWLVLGLVAGAGAVAAWLLVRRRRSRLTPRSRRIVFPFAANSLSKRALDAALRLAKAEGSLLVPVYLATVPRDLPLDAALPREAERALPILETIERRALPNGVECDGRIERGRTLRHALRQLTEHERYERIVVSATDDHGHGFAAADIAWLLEHAPGEILVLRPAEEAR